MTYEEFLAVPTGALVEFEVLGADRPWQGWLASSLFGVLCEGGPDADHGFVAVHTEPIAFYCVNIQIASADWRTKIHTPGTGQNPSWFLHQGAPRAGDVPARDAARVVRIARDRPGISWEPGTQSSSISGDE